MRSLLNKRGHGIVFESGQQVGGVFLFSLLQVFFWGVPMGKLVINIQNNLFSFLQCVYSFRILLDYMDILYSYKCRLYFLLLATISLILLYRPISVCVLYSVTPSLIWCVVQRCCALFYYKMGMCLCSVVLFPPPPHILDRGITDYRLYSTSHPLQ